MVCATSRELRILCLARRSRLLNLIYIWGNERSCLHLLTGALCDLAGAEDRLPELAGQARAFRDGARAIALSQPFPLVVVVVGPPVFRAGDIACSLRWCAQVPRLDELLGAR